MEQISDKAKQLEKFKKYESYINLRPEYQKLLDDFHKELGFSQLSPKITHKYFVKILKLMSFLNQINITDITKVTTDMLNTFLSSVYNEVNRFGTKNHSKHLADYVYALKRFFEVLELKEMIASNPAVRLNFPKISDSLPKSILNKEEVMRILETPDITTFQGLKDRAVLELFYGCGIRNGELKNLKLSDVDLKNGILFVFRGKGQKDRNIPIGKNTAYWLEKYLNLRKALAPDCPYFFLAVGEKSPLNGNGIWNIIRRAKKKAGILKPVYPHTLRHCFATHLLEEGAPLPAISALLGHSSLETTKVYTHIDISKLKEYHRKYHPGENRKVGDKK